MGWKEQVVLTIDTDTVILGVTMISDERVEIALEELQDLKGVWNELLKIWEKIDEMKEQPWLSVQPRKVSCNTTRTFPYCGVK